MPKTNRDDVGDLMVALLNLTAELRSEEARNAQGDNGRDMLDRYARYERKRLVPLLKRFGYLQRQ